MTNEDRQLIEVVMGMFRELSADVRALREDNHRDHINQREALRDSTESLVRKIEDVRQGVRDLNEWRDGHNNHHGKNDEDIARRLGYVELSEHDQAVANGAVAAYKKRFAWLGALGLDALKWLLGLIGAGLLLLLGFLAPGIWRALGLGG